MENKKHTTDRTDELLRMALEDYVRQAPSELKTKKQTQEEGELHQFSPEVEKRFEEMLSKAKEEKRRAIHKKVFVRIAACFLIVLCVGMVTVASVEAIRIPFMSFFLSIGQESAEMVGSEENHVPVTEEYIDYYPTNIPERFFMVSYSEYDNGYTASYQSESGEYFQLDCYESSKIFSFDAEESDIEKIMIHNSEAAVSVKDGRVVITWPTTDYNFILAGDIPKDEALEILKSIQFN